VGYRAILAGGGTGGHLYPALNLAEALQRRADDGLEVLLVGAQRGIEARVLPERGVPHRLLPLEPLYRSRPWRNWRLAVSAARCAHALRALFAEFRPHLVVGTGGYVAGPVVGWAVLRGLRTAIQEQNSYPGLTTRWLAPYVDQLHLGYEEAMSKLLPGRYTEVRIHGNPIRWPAERPHPTSVRSQFGLRPGRVLLVVGGSQGAAGVNAPLLAALEAVARGALPPLPRDVQILWSTGPAHHGELAARLARLSDRVAVRAVPYIAEMERALSITTLAVSRAGALALAELCAWGVPALLIPLPHAAADHQRFNARTLEAAGAATVIEEAELAGAPERLWKAVLELLGDRGRLQFMAQAALARGNPHAADAIAADLWRLMEDR
jgi:UDP-N-acetylglucosamine--N-acetylmuramyl-(pentapeptide) pyrophosphoryl-undecaprenol N-acetylglucosamine transferase